MRFRQTGQIKLRLKRLAPVAGVEVRFADDGEILVRGEVLMKGYWRDDHSTAAAIQDGWLHTVILAVVTRMATSPSPDEKKK